MNIDIPLPKGNGKVAFGNKLPLSFMIGPNTLESRAHALEMALAIKEIADKYKIGVVFKTSFDKANRSSVKSSRGIGIDAAVPIFAEIKEKTGMPIITDVHEPDQCVRAAEIVDILQIPAFLCRQTDLLLAAGKTGKPINVKKGQFLAPWDMKNIVTKIASITATIKILLQANVVSVLATTRSVTRICALSRLCQAKPVAQLFSMQRIPCSNQAARATAPAASVNLCRSWHALP